MFFAIMQASIAPALFLDKLLKDEYCQFLRGLAGYQEVGAKMVARIWRGRVKPGKLEEYRAMVERSGESDYKNTPGNLGAWILTRDLGEYGEIVTLSFWESREAIKGFAGDDISLARYYPGDADYLLEMNEHVEHYDA
jgi:heme-degrading monooxygenase HmoA